MSDPYYNNNQNYGSQYPQGGYGQQQNYQQYPPQQSGGGYPPQDFGPPRRQDSFGPPQHGGFQHGQAGHQFGGYDASNPQGQPNYYGGYDPNQQQHHQQGGYQQQGQGNSGYDAFQQNQAYQQQQQQGGYNSQPTGSNAGVPQTAPQSTDPNAPNYDPNAPPMTESDRGLLGALAGGFGGHKLGANQGHGFLGMIGGAIAGSFAEDALKKKKKQHHSSSNYGGSSWGGSRW